MSDVCGDEWSIRRGREPVEERECMQRELGEFCQTLQRQAEFLGALMARMERMSSAGENLQARFLEVCEEILNRQDEMESTLRDIRRALGDTSEGRRPRHIGDVSGVPRKHVGDQEYQEVVSRIRHIVSDVLPTNATVLVVSRGDEKLLRLEGCRAWHFPRNEAGVYAATTLPTARGL